MHTQCYKTCGGTSMQFMTQWPMACLVQPIKHESPWECSNPRGLRSWTALHYKVVDLVYSIARIYQTVQTGKPRILHVDMLPSFEKGVKHQGTSVMLASKQHPLWWHVSARIPGYPQSFLCCGLTAHWYLAVWNKAQVIVFSSLPYICLFLLHSSLIPALKVHLILHLSGTYSFEMIVSINNWIWN